MTDAMCPFCGKRVTRNDDRSVVGHPIVDGCPLSGDIFNARLWNRRLPPAAQPSPAAVDVEELIREVRAYGCVPGPDHAADIDLVEAGIRNFFGQSIAPSAPARAESAPCDCGADNWNRRAPVNELTHALNCSTRNARAESAPAGFSFAGIRVNVLSALPDDMMLVSSEIGRRIETVAVPVAAGAPAGEEPKP